MTDPDEGGELPAYYDSDEEKDTGAGAEKKKTDEKEAADKDSHSTIYLAGFKDFVLKPELLRAITDCGFEHPSQVQHEAIPQALMGTDVLCQAKSGMGKTAVFTLAVLHRLVPVDGEVHALILCHARELAFQISNEFKRFKKYLPTVKTGVFYGGVPVREDRKTLKDSKTTPHVVIGTPGRIKQLVEEGALNLKHLKQFILDECDRMLESLDMRKDVQTIFKATPHDKQVMMFSATLSEKIRPVCRKFMHNPHEIFINDTSKLTLHGLQQYYVQLEEDAKNRKLVDLLDELDFNQLVIFVKSTGRAEELNKLLRQCNFPSICVYAGVGRHKMSQEERIKRYNAFKNFEARILVTTDLMGRGIDIERINVVINYDMPESVDAYLHRVGRAGRFGTKGLGISFVSSKEEGTLLNDIQKRFVVDIKTLPDKIDSTTYMTA